LKLADIGLPVEHAFSAVDVLNQNAPVTLRGGTVRIENQLPESVRMIKIIDGNVSPRAPSVKAQVPSAAYAGDTIHLAAQTEGSGVPAVEYRWDFGDGTSASGAKVSHAYTRAAPFTISLTVDGVDGVPAVQSFTVNVTGDLRALHNLTDNRRYQDPTDH
jgi:hypothetical protein